MTDAKEQEFLKRLRETFRIEASEHLSALSAGLIQLEQTADPASRAEIVEGIFREAHSLKGAARSVNLKDVEALCQPLESVLAALKRQEIILSPALFDLLLQTVDSLTQQVSSTEGERTSADRAQYREVARRLENSAQGNEPPDGPEPAQPPAETPPAEAEQDVHVSELAVSTPPSKAAEPDPYPQALLSETARPRVRANITGLRTGPEVTMAETVKIPVTRLDPLLLQAEEMIQAKLAASQRAIELREIRQALVSLKIEAAKWKNQRGPGLTELPEWAAARLDLLAAKVASVSLAFDQDERVLRHMVDEHLEAMKQILMLPVSNLVEVFPRLVRDLARDQGKEVDLILRGAEIKVDKRILEELKDPLIHLLRNCVDHGIEKPEVRAGCLKPGRGTITAAFNATDSRHFEILLSDDGAGIDLDGVRAAAIKAGILTDEAAEKLSPLETLALIFQSGVSTTEMITDVSGRGLGLAIVSEKVEKLGGVVSVESNAGSGTTFRLLLPLTLATFRGVLVRSRQQVFVLPTVYVERAIRVDREATQTVENRATIRLNGQILALVNLGDILGLPVQNNDSNRQHSAAEASAAKYVPVLILTSSEARIAVQVDEILAEEEILVKGLGKQLSRVRNISGATILGTGKVVPVLNAVDLMNSALHPVTAIGMSAAAEQVAARTGHILVAEDSITSRSLLKNILETGGYQVTTAIDGADAFTQLRSGEFDLLVSDVDMPRMSGFELTSKIRGDKKLAELPVVLVTALESRQDRERGIDVGANAYIIKSSFDQSNLLEVIGRLL